MKRQRGIAPGWLYLIGVVVVVLAVTGLVVAVNSHDASVDKKGYQRGKEEEIARYMKRDNEALRVANETIVRLTTEARAKEAAYQATVAALELKLSKEAKANANRTQADRDAVRSGALVMRDPGKPATSATNCGPGPGPKAVAATSGGNGESGAELSGAAAEFLLVEAGRADAVVIQLAAAQALIVEQVRTCNGP